MIRRTVSILAMVLVTATIVLAPAVADGTSVGLHISPEAHIPVGLRAENYRLGIGGRLEGMMSIPGLMWTAPSLELGYAFIPLELGQESYRASTNLTLIRTGVSARGSLSMGDRLSAFAHGRAGAFLGVLSGDSTSAAPGVALGIGGGIGIVVAPQLLIEVSAAYETYLRLFNGLTFALSATAGLSGPGNTIIPRSATVRFAPGGAPVDGYIDFSSIELDRIFPVLYKYYDDHPIGRATITNSRSRSIEDVEIRLSLNQYMDTPKLSARMDRLKAGESREIDIYALFTEPILSITEGAKIAAELTASYTASGRSGIDSEVVTLETYNRNALRWDDDKKIAAFVTARDEEVQRFARNVASVVDDAGMEAVERALQLGMVLFGAMDENRCVYVPDPSSPYAEMSKDSQAVDSVQFPRQTLLYRAGDCDDLSATYAALLEAVGVPTAFITVPGHIYGAFKLDMSRDDARALSRSEDIIIDDEDAVWIPVETTLLKQGFLAAWAEGARQWREHSQEDNAELITVRDAWLQYEPVAFGVSDAELDIPSREDVTTLFQRELDRFVSQEIEGREHDLLTSLRNRPSDARIHNRLGVLYARYGRYKDAEEQLSAALELQPYVPALVNLGNIALLQGELGAAGEFYRRALEEEPENNGALLGVARVAYESENYAAAESAHARLSELSPDLASQFAYLGSAVQRSERASDAVTTRRATIWQEE